MELAGNKKSQIFNKLKIWPDWTIKLRVTGPCVLKTGTQFRTCPGHSPFSFSQLFFKHADNQDKHEITDEFETGLHYI